MKRARVIIEQKLQYDEIHVMVRNSLGRLEPMLEADGLPIDLTREAEDSWSNCSSLNLAIARFERVQDVFARML